MVMLGNDSLSDDRETRVAFLTGRIQCCLALPFGLSDYGVPFPSEDDPEEEASQIVVTNGHTRRRYRISVEELSDD